MQTSVNLHELICHRNCREYRNTIGYEISVPHESKRVSYNSLNSIKYYIYAIAPIIITMDKILVHATSLDNLSNILLSGFLAHPSLAILNNEQKQSSTKSTPLDNLSFNFGNVVLLLIQIMC